jgi:uncharacterized spore protein YtfJ
MDQSVLNNNVDTLFKSLENFTQNEGIIGKPVVQGDKTFLPVVSITVGYGGGNAGMSSAPAMGTGPSKTGTGALGLGAKLCTDAVIVIDDQGVSMLPMSTSAASSLMDKIPQIISGMKPGQGQNQSGGQNKSS